MNFMDIIYQRRSVRNYTDKQVEKEIINTLLEAAVQAPSAMNGQPWAFAVIQNRVTLTDLSQKAKKLLVDNLADFPVLSKYKQILVNPDFNIFYDAQCLVVVYAKNASQYASEDCCLAAQNIMLTAYELGLGSCWIGFARPYLNTAEFKKQYNIPEEYAAVAPIILGYPTKDIPLIKKQAPEVLYWK